MEKLKVAMIQMKVEFNKADENLQRAEQFVREAAEKEAQICVIPECSDLGWGNPRANELAAPIPGRISNFYCDIASKYHIYLVVGLTEQCDQKIYNSALLISEDGEILLHHRKINILTGVEDVYAVGDSLAVANTPLGCIGINICADNSFNSVVLGHSLARMGAQIILSPCSWAVKPDRDVQVNPYGEEWFKPYLHLSSLYQIPIIGVSNVGIVSDGTWKGWKVIGNSIAVDSDGKIRKILPYGEEAQTMEIAAVTLIERKRQGTSLSEEVAAKLTLLNT